MENSYILELKNIKKNFGGIQALKGVNFQLKKGEVHALLGENGAGKSTLIKIITGVHQANEGEIILEGKATKIHSPIDAREKGIAAIYQELSLINSLTVAENIFLGNEPLKAKWGLCDKKKLIERSQKYLDDFKIDIDCRKKVSELGMGQKRIIEIVKALAIDSKILLLDEPTTGMSKVEIETLFEIMNRLKEKRVTMIYISHYLEEIFKVCNRATVFRDGSNVAVYEMDKVTNEQLINSMIGKVINKNSNKHQRVIEDKDPILELKDFKTDLMHEAVSLKVHKKEIVGVTGIVGSGKSELAHSIFGNAKKISGEVLLGGNTAKIKSPVDAKKYKIALIPEDRKAEGLFLKDTISNNMVVANIDNFEGKFGIINNKKKKAECEAIGSKLKVMPLKLDMDAGNLSGGNQQKVVIAKWLIGNPELVLMDEPTRGIDVGAKVEIYDLIRNLADSGKGMLIMSSEYEELIDLCDRIIVLYKGKIVGEVKPEEATNEKLLTLSLGG